MASASFNPYSAIANWEPITKENLAAYLNKWRGYHPRSFHMPALDFSGLQTIAFLKALKTAYITRFKYSGDTSQVDPYMMEEFQWTYGKYAVVKFKGKFIVGTYSVVTYDHNSDPVRIKFFTATQSNIKGDGVPLSQTFTVGEDAVVGYDDRPNYANSGYVMAPWLIARTDIQVLQRMRSEIHRNFLASRTVIPMSPLTEPDIVHAMDRALLNGSTFVPIGTEYDTLAESTKDLKIEDRSQNLWENYYNEYDHLKEKLGFVTNAMPGKKERQQNKEIDSTNMVAKAVLKGKLLMRQRGLEKLKAVFKIAINVTLDEVAEEQEPELPVKENENGNKAT